jgi:hypothetical protein
MGLAMKYSRLRISCQFLHLPKGFDLKNKSTPWIRSIDYHLECCIDARFWKIAISRKKSFTGKFHVSQRPDILKSII